MSDKSKHTWVGWQGVMAEVPADWSLSAVNGSENSGYFRADNTANLMLEVKWQKVGKQVDLHKKLDEYLNDLRRRARKRRADFEHKIKSKDAGMLTFTWRSDRKAQGRLWYCAECSKVIIAQISGGASEDISGLASTVLTTIEDHSDDGWRTWAMYDLIVEVPPGYSLEKHQLMAGYIRLAFRKKSSRLVIERWGLANVALRGRTLGAWFRERVGYDLKQYGCSIEEVDFDGEKGIQISGRRTGISLVTKSAGELLTFRKPAIWLDGYAWVCEESNKVFSIQSTHTGAEKIVDQVLERIECH
jgi:hypothetical protein